MKLQAKVMLIMVITWLVICAFVIADSKFVVAQDYQNLEKEIVKHRIQDAQRAFDRMLYSLSLYALAWSQWDDAYEFMQVKSEKFIKSNFLAAIYRSSDLNFILFFDTQGKLHYGRAYDIKTNQLTPVPQALLDYLNKHQSFVTSQTPASSQVGILQTKIGLIVMSSRPVVMSSGKLPVRGSVLMGYYLDNAFFKTLSQTVGMKVSFFPTSTVLNNKQLYASYVSLTSGRNYSVVPINPRLEYGFVLLKDIHASPVGLLRVEIPRVVYEEGVATSYHYFVIVLLSGVIVMLLVWYVLKLLVLDRILSISKQVLKINSERQFDQKIIVSGHDELNNMVFTINHMLELISSSQAHLHYLASHDALTQLPNREHFYELLSQAMAKANTVKSKIAVMFIDIDKLKKVNDNYGHAVGDKLIKIVANRIKNSIRGVDVVARQSGDEFILFMPDITEVSVITNTAERILQVTAKPFNIGNNIIKVSLSIGISIYPEDGATIEKLVKHADDVMYATKIKSGNNYQYYSDEVS